MAQAEERAGKSGKSAGAAAAGVQCASIASQLDRAEQNCAPVPQTVRVPSHLPVGSERRNEKGVATTDT